MVQVGSSHIFPLYLSDENNAKNFELFLARRKPLAVRWGQTENNST